MYEQVLELDSELVVARNNLAVLLTEQDGSQAALNRAAELSRPFANSEAPPLLDTLGWVYYRLGDSEQATRYLKRAIDNGGTNPTMLYHLGMAYAQAGDSVRARDALEQALAKGTNFPGAPEAQATLSSLL